MTSYTPPPLDDDPAYTGLLEANAAARQMLLTAQSQLKPSAMSDAEQVVAETSGDILAYELRRAADLVRALRWAQQHNPNTLRDVLNEATGLGILRDDIRELRSDADTLAEVVAALEGQQ